MEARIEASPTIEKVLSQRPRHSGPYGQEEPTSGSDIAVVFTSSGDTLGALKAAAALASRSNARINLIVPQLVPFPLPLSSPPVLIDFNERRFQALASQSPVETTVRVYLCRDKWDAITVGLRPNSLVVLGVRKGWWPTRETSLAKRLRRAGHEVIVVEPE